MKEYDNEIESDPEEEQAAEDHQDEANAGGMGCSEGQQEHSTSAKSEQDIPMDPAFPAHGHVPEPDATCSEELQPAVSGPQNVEGTSSKEVASEAGDASGEPASSSEVPRAGHDHGGGGGGVKVNRTPAALFASLEAPGFKLMINYGDWRFSAMCKTQTSDNTPDPPYHNKSYSKSFQRSKDEWKAALMNVHEHMWRKHRLMTKAVHLNVPEIPDDTLAEIQEAVIDKLPAPKVYPSKS